MKSKSKQHLYSFLILGITLLLSVAWVASAAADAFIESFTTTSALAEGTVVEVVPSNTSAVEPVSHSTATNALGVVVDTTNPPSSSQVDVATSGHFDVLVSDQNGPITTGDYLNISGVSGVAMKDDGSESISIGQALGSFDGQHGVTETTQATLANGSSQTVHLGLVQANINVAASPLANAEQRYVPPFLRRAAGVISNGKLLSPWRIYVALAVAVSALVGFTLITYAGVRSALIAEGRNPLAKSGILRTLLMVLGVAVALLVVGAIGAVLLLRL